MHSFYLLERENMKAQNEKERHFMLRPFNRQNYINANSPKMWNLVMFSGVCSSFDFTTNMSVIIPHQKYYMAILQASKLAYKDDVICLTLRFKLQCSKFTGSYKAEKELYLEMYEQSKCLIQITQPKWLLKWFWCQ